MIYDLIVETYEGDRSVPVVTHIFHGNTPDQAKAFYRAHLKADSFMRKCGSQGRFGNFQCRNVIRGIKKRPG